MTRSYKLPRWKRLLRYDLPEAIGLLASSALGLGIAILILTFPR